VKNKKNVGKKMGNQKGTIAKLQTNSRLTPSNFASSFSIKSNSTLHTPARSEGLKHPTLWIVKLNFIDKNHLTKVFSLQLTPLEYNDNSNMLFVSIWLASSPKICQANKPTTNPQQTHF
jgi:hypothetical protein